ncbi:MAG: hypothetical protein GXP32_08190 [Kiritimatiellaeota bacterium]|nr:hypothetical protein [Kiritimatiellota bacterium]
MSNHNIEELCFTAADSSDEGTLETLIQSLRGLDSLKVPEVEAGIEFMLEAWGGSIDDSVPKSEFCMNLAMLSAPDTPILRISLQKAFSKLKKTQFLKSAIVKATGVRDASVDPKTAAERFLSIESLTSSITVFNPAGQRFGEVTQLDVMTSEISVGWRGSAAIANVSLEAVARDMILLELSYDTLSLPDLAKNTTLSSEEWRSKMRDAAPIDIDDKLLRQMAVALADESDIPHESLFEWWSVSSEVSKRPHTRHPSEARTIHELHTILLAFGKSEMSEEELSVMGETLKSLNFGDSPADSKLLAESMAMLSECLSPGTAAEICAVIASKVVFWPENPSKPANPADLLPWTEISVKHLVDLAELTLACHSTEYLAELLLSLSLRCWNAITQVVGADAVVSALKSRANTTPDALLWIWKNTARISRELSPLLTTKAIASSLDGASSSPAATQLKKLFVSDGNFHKLLLDNADADDMMQVLFAIQACKSLRLDEKQTLLVKLSSLSPALKKLLDGGEGERLFSEVSKNHLRKQKEDEPKVSSLRSMSEMSANLKDLITRQIPENAAAIAHARSYGDLKENAEYKAAKEHQAFLNRRAGEFERAINETLPLDFSTINPGNEAVPGSTVTLVINGGPEKETYYLLGAWDGDPEKLKVAYTSALGMTLNEKTVGEKIKLPDGRSAVIESVAKLPDDLSRHLANTN